ncbi:MAG: IS21 family transposase [Solirubrobacteraceae bacterium]
MDDYGNIRRAHRDGMSIREIARAFGHSRRKVRQVLAEAQPRPYTRRQPPPAPVLGPFHAAIDAMLADDEQAPRKQRHTAMQVFRRLQAELGYRGGYDQVRRYIGHMRRDRRETFMPLAHDPGQRLEADFGHIHVDFPDGRRLVPVLIAAWSYSNYPFALAVPTERTEAILAGMVEAFAFFGCAPHEVWWDNPRTVVSKIFRGRGRCPSERYAALASHYAFDPLFCMPARGNEKPYAETRVRVLQRQWSTPVPKAAHLGALNAYLRERCVEEAGRTVRGYEESIGQRFRRDRAAARGLPAHPFDACVMQPACVDKYQTVHFDRNRYSVPRACAYRSVTVKGYVDRVEVVAAGSVVARHPRSYGKDEQVLDPLHYLATRGRRPAALDHAPALRDGRLPESFTRLRAALEGRHGAVPGARQYIRVLQLLAEHPLERVRRAVEDGLRQGEPAADQITGAVLRLAAAARVGRPEEGVTSGCHGDVTPLCQVQVPRPDLGRFDQLLSRGGPDDERE